MGVHALGRSVAPAAGNRTLGLVQLQAFNPRPLAPSPKKAICCRIFIPALQVVVVGNRVPARSLDMVQLPLSSGIFEETS